MYHEVIRVETIELLDDIIEMLRAQPWHHMIATQTRWVSDDGSISTRLKKSTAETVITTDEVTYIVPAQYRQELVKGIRLRRVCMYCNRDMETGEEWDKKTVVSHGICNDERCLARMRIDMGE